MSRELDAVSSMLFLFFVTLLADKGFQEVLSLSIISQYGSMILYKFSYYMYKYSTIASLVLVVRFSLTSTYYAELQYKLWII